MAGTNEKIFVVAERLARLVRQGFKSRRFVLWLVSLACVLLIYGLYSRINRAPDIKIEAGAARSDSVADGTVGMVGEVGVGTVQVARFTELDKYKRVEREFGFEKLLHSQGEKWDLQKPFMDIYRPGFKCSITADNGQVTVETAGGKTIPKDAVLTDNVVIHILPNGSGDIEESFIYLDDISYVSDRSQFWTDGPVRFVSRSAQMLGRGLEIIYNKRLGRLEFLKITDLERLHLKTRRRDLLSSKKPDGQEVVKNVGLGVAKSESPADAPKSGSKSAKSGSVKTQKSDQVEEELYSCVFSKNVFVDCPEQLIFADTLSINDIVISSTKDDRQVSGGDAKADAKNAQGGTASPADGSKKSVAIKPPEQTDDIVVTCDDGFVVLPMESSLLHKSSVKIKQFGKIIEKSNQYFGDANGRTTFAANRIDYSTSSEDVVARGGSQLSFYVSDDMESASGELSRVPVKIRANKKAKFIPHANEVIFEGECRCTMVSEKAAGWRQEYSLSAPRVSVYLSETGGKKLGTYPAQIEHLTADGGRVQLANAKRTNEKLLGFSKLKCLRFDYDPGKGLCTAKGPGLIAIDNSKIYLQEESENKFDLQQQCYALMEGFESLKYWLNSGRIVADSEKQQIGIGYIGPGKKQQQRKVKATASHIEADIEKVGDGRNELAWLRATGGVSYQEADIQFVGSEMFYDAEKGLLTAKGSDFEPCLLNGVPVDGVRYDLKTGRAVKSKIVAPGVFR